MRPSDSVGRTQLQWTENPRYFKGTYWGLGAVWLATKITLPGGHQPYALQAVLLELWSNWTLFEGLPGQQRSGEGRKRSQAEQWGEASARGCAAPLGISCRLTAVPTAVHVVATVNGLSVQLVVDAGSEKTFVGEDLVDVGSVLEVTQQLCGDTGQCVAMWGPVMVNINVGSVLERLPVFIAALEDLCLLGIDFLTCVGASLDL
ncbi:hypothetical protein E2C01_054621 [Portunus trituberculatus]|uniref:Peptidase A2 domain-containing protein n=1 Tax=Portunus trituberculatus TaxID=210409 RepID=A0A5B7GSH9_PORTR|nr:hypothetical protein [Portunus trituberculatus]